MILPRFLFSAIAFDPKLITGEKLLKVFHSSFAEKVQQLENVTGAEKKALLAAVEQEIIPNIFTAYVALMEYLNELKSVATNEVGVSRFEHGDAYYASRLRHFTTLDVSADEARMNMRCKPIWDACNLGCRGRCNWW